MSLDRYVADNYASPAKVLVQRGTELLTKAVEGYIGIGVELSGNVKIKEGLEFLKEARRKEPAVDLSSVSELVYNTFRTISSDLEQQEARIRSVFAVAREVEAPINEMKFAEYAYNSVTNLGDHRLHLAESLGIPLDPARIRDEVYSILARQDLKPESFWGRAFDGLIYAESKGARVDKAKLPQPERIEPLIQSLLEWHQEAEAVRYLRALKRWGLTLADDRTIDTLDRTAELLSQVRKVS